MKQLGRQFEGKPLNNEPKGQFKGRLLAGTRSEDQNVNQNPSRTPREERLTN